MGAETSMIIIGAGVAGLATGCYALMNGYDVQIFEMHDKPGGMCTSWQRKGYTFDYCIHNLAGTSPKSGLRRLWDELGVLDGIDIISRDEFNCIEDPAGQTFHWYTDLDRLEEHLGKIAPNDIRTIKKLVDAARKFRRADLFSVPLGGMGSMLKALPMLRTVKHWSGVTATQFADRFNDPFMRRAWPHAQYDIPGMVLPMTPPLLFMGNLAGGDLGWPAGGSLAFSRRLEQRFLDLGGEIHYRSPVEKIIVENNQAVGVRVNEAESRAGRVVSAADGQNTIYRLLEGRYLTESIEKYYGSAGDGGPFGLIVFLGISGELTGYPHALTMLLDEEIRLGDISQDSLYLVTFGAETGLAPEGHSIIKIETQARYPYWKHLRENDPDAYRAQKYAVADEMIDRISPRFPGLREKIEVVDVSTFVTAERFTGNRFGMQAGPPTENAETIQRYGLSKTLPGLTRFHHVGQWSNATMGVSSVALTGRDLIRGLCKQDRRRFKTA